MVTQFLDKLKNYFPHLSDAEILGPSVVNKKYGATTFCDPIQLDAALKVKTRQDISTLFSLANQFGWELYPVSSGRNWGYGSIALSNSSKPKVVVDLCLLNKITPTSKDLGLITLEPGVTQQQLYDYLAQNEWEAMVPVTGAGPHCSIVSNALERGYGITPFTDHFSAVTALKAYLPHPELCQQEYQSLVSHLDASGVDFVDKSHKWGLGSYLDGLFTQSNMGIVTEMTIRLAKKKEGSCAFYLQCFEENKLASLVSSIRTILSELEGVVGSINLMDQRRLLTMVADNPQSPDMHAVMSATQVAELSNKNRMPKWMIVGTIYGSAELTKAAKKIIKKLISTYGKLLFSDGALLNVARMVSKGLPYGPLLSVKQQLASLDEGIEIMQGKPNQVALPLAYWRNPKIKPDKSRELNPAQDGCGLLWYAPLLPMTPESVTSFVNFIRDTTPKFGIEPLITFTNLRHDCVDSTVPILFNLHDSMAVKQAHDCLQALVESGLKKGFVPYRLNIHQQKELLHSDFTHVRFTHGIKGFIDPNQVLSPNRY